MRVKSIILWSLFSVCVATIGCVPRQSLIHGAPTEGQFVKEGALPGAADLIRAVARIDTEQSGIRYTADATLVLKKPSYLRLEILPLMGVTGFCVITAPEKMMVYLPSQNKVYTGKPSSQNIVKFFPLPLEAQEIVYMLTGSIHGLTDEGVEKRLYRENEAWQLDMTWPSGVSQTVWFKDEAVIRFKRFVNGQKTSWLSAEYAYDKGPSPLPSKIIFTINGGYVKITYTDVSVEQTEDVSVFDMEIPSDAEVISLD